MKLFNLLGFVIGIILAFVCYFATSNIFIGVGVLLFYLIIYFLLFHKKIQYFLINISKIQECYFFINNFLITLSIKGSLNAAFDATKTSISDEYKEYIESIDELNPQEKLLYLNKYFPYHIFQIFVDVVLLWLDEGGDILEMSSHITNEIREIKEYTTYCQSIGKRKALETFVLWFFTLAILVVLKLSLSSTYAEMLNQPVFLIAVILMAVLFIFSIYLLINKVTVLEIRRSDNA